MNSKVWYPTPGDPDYREASREELEGTIDDLLGELDRLRQIEAATRLVWTTHFNFPGLTFVPESPLDLLRMALEAK